MSSPTDKLSDLLLRFRVRINETAANLCRQALEAMQQGRLPEAISYAEAALRDGTIRNDRGTQAVAYAYLAAAYARDKNFVAAVRQARDCQQLFKQLGSLRNRTYAKALLATIYRLQLEMICTELIDTLEGGRFDSRDLRDRSLRKGDAKQAAIYYNHFIEFDTSLRRMRWVPAISHVLPLRWVPVIDDMAPDPRLHSPEIVGYMEPVIIITHSLDREGYLMPNLYVLSRKGTGGALRLLEPSQFTGALYAAYRLPKIGSLGSDPPVPAGLEGDVVYVAIKIDPQSAQLAGYRDGDYLLVRSASSSAEDGPLQRGDSDLTGWSFEFGEDGKTKFFTAVPPKFVGEPRIKMFDLQIDAILRRVP